jgi:hypothetical protein
MKEIPTIEEGIEVLEFILGARRIRWYEMIET